MSALPRLRARRTLALAGLLALVACASRSPAGETAGDRVGQGAPRRTVLVIGDSLTVGARLFGDLEQVLGAAGWDAQVLAEDGRAVDWGLEQARGRSQVPGVVVVGLGTNPGPAPDQFRDDVRELVAELTARGARAVVWIPPGDAADAGRAGRARAVRSLAGGALRVTDWRRTLAAHPGWLADDGIHLTESGYRGLSRHIRDQLAATPTG